LRIAWRAPLVSILSLMILPNARAAGCPIGRASVKEAVSFLKVAKGDNSVSPECVITAINRIHKARSKEEIDVLVEYLDYERPWREEEVASSSTMEQYPAVSNLFATGRSALPALVGLLKRTDASNIARENAVRTIMAIFRDDPPAGITFLGQEATNSKDGGEATLLRQAASDGVRWCYDRYRSRCQAVLDSPNF
jgi:hypothetical protein